MSWRQRGIVALLRLAALGTGAYNAGYDVSFRDHYSNYMPGALILSRRDKAFEPSRRLYIYRYKIAKGRD